MCSDWWRHLTSEWSARTRTCVCCSDHFDTSTTLTVVGGETGLKQIHYTSSARTHSAVHVASYANAQTFRCSAQVPYLDDTSIGITPSMKCKCTQSQRARTRLADGRGL